MRTIKKICAVVLCLVVMVSEMSPAVYAVEPRYEDIIIILVLDIDDGVAACTMQAEGRSFYNEYRVNMVLYQDDDDLASWSYTGICSVDATEYCNVTRGHEYYLGIHVKVYDPNGNFIEQVIDYTPIYDYQ